MKSPIDLTGDDSGVLTPRAASKHSDAKSRKTGNARSCHSWFDGNPLVSAANSQFGVGGSKNTPVSIESDSDSDARYPSRKIVHSNLSLLGQSKDVSQSSERRVSTLTPQANPM